MIIKLHNLKSLILIYNKKQITIVSIIKKFNLFLLESIGDKVTLYRGDSIYIDEFNYDKFDNKAIYGIGLYLTDNKRVAYTYTLKGNNTAIVTEIFPTTNRLKNAELCFIIEHLVNKVNNTHFSEDELRDAYDTIKQDQDIVYKDYIDRYKIGDDLFWISKEYAKKVRNNDEEYKSYSEYYKTNVDRVEKIIKKSKEIHDKYDKYIEKATSYYNLNKRDYDFLNDGDGWRVVYNPSNEGHISEFEVSKSVIERCYNANTTMTNDILSIIKKMVNKYLKSEQVKNYLIKHPYSSKYFTYKYIYTNAIYGDIELTLSNFLYNNRIFRDTRNNTAISADIWKYFITEMQKLGYKGIVYDGGEHLNSPITHNAYVIWNLEDVERLS